MNIKAPSRPWHGASEGIKRVAAAVRRRDWEPIRAAKEGDGAQPQPLGQYVAAVSQSLAVFRFVSFAMGAGLVFTLNPSDQQPVVLGMAVLLAGVFNVYRVLWRVDPTRPAGPVRWASLGADIVLSGALTFMSGTLDSPFLIYSLSPILTASLLMNLRTAMVIATVFALFVSGVHVLAGVDVGDAPWILSGNYLVLALLYSAVCSLVVSLPFLANLNWQRRVRSESLASERQRLRREVHDNVAQTLAFLSLKMKLAEQRSSVGKVAITQRDVAEIGKIVERTYLAVRDYLDGTVEESEDPLGVRLPAIADQWSRDTGLAVKTVVKGAEGLVPPQVRSQLLQVAREALANVAKHAYSKNAWVDLECNPQEVVMRIRDDGRGFATPGIKGHGMGIMSERAAMAGASLEINSTPGKGTEVIVTYPRGAEQNGGTSESDKGSGG